MEPVKQIDNLYGRQAGSVSGMTLSLFDFIKNGTISPRYLQKLIRVIFQ